MIFHQSRDFNTPTRSSWSSRRRTIALETMAASSTTVTAKAKVFWLHDERKTLRLGLHAAMVQGGKAIAEKQPERNRREDEQTRLRPGEWTKFRHA